MKKSLFTALATACCVITVFYMACTPQEQNYLTEKAAAESQHIFWTRSDLGVGQIKVYMDDEYWGTISNFYANGVQCYAENSAYNLTVAEYSAVDEYYDFKAVADNGSTWEWGVTFEPGKCESNELTEFNASLFVKNCNSLDGVWVRQNDNGLPGTTGMKINFSNGQGIITDVGNDDTAFKLGQVKWRNFDKAQCTLEDLLSYSIATYTKTGISFTDPNNVYMTGGVHYKRQ